MHNFGRADQVDRDGLKRLVDSINRVLDQSDTVIRGAQEIPQIELDRVFELGVVLAARALWKELGIGEAIRTRLTRAHLSAPHEMALFAMAAQRLDDPGSKLGCATRWLPDIAWLPEAEKLAVDQLYRALDFLAVWSEEIERTVFLRSADLLRLDADLIFYDTTTAYFEIDEPDEHCELWGGRLFAPLRQRGHSKEGRDANPQVVIAMAVTRDGMPARSWVLPGNTADVATVARVKQDLHAWRLGRCLFVGDAAMHSADNLAEPSRGLGRHVLAVPMRRVGEVEAEVLSRPGRYRKVADNLEVKEVWVGDGERRKRYVLCFNPAEAVALAYKSGAIIESCFRRMKQTGLEVRPMFHWAPRRIEAHVKLCVLALQVQRTAEIRTGLPWARIARLLGTLKAVRHLTERQTIVQRTKIGPELAGPLKQLGISAPKQVMAVIEAAETPATS